MRPEDPRSPLDAALEDVEQQADALSLADRDAEVAQLRRAEYASVDLASRLRGSLGRRLLVSVPGPGPLEGTLTRAGAGWLLLDAGDVEWVVVLAAVGSVRGLGERVVPEDAQPVTDRLGLASVLRALADERPDVLLHRSGLVPVRGLLRRVGADFAEVLVGTPGEAAWTETVPLAAVTAVRCG